MADSHLTATGSGNKAYIGSAYLYEDSGDLTFYDPTTAATKTLTQLLAGGTITDLDTAFDGGKGINGATSEANAFYVGGATDYFTFWQEGANDLRISTSAGANVTLACSGGTFSFSDDIITTTGNIVAGGDITLSSGSIVSASGAISFGNENLTTTGTINIGADNVNLTLGASGATDAQLYFDGAGNLMFYDSNLGVATSLTALAGGSLTSPTIAGDVVISDGKLTWTDAVDEVPGAFTFSNVTNDGLDILANSMTTANLVHVKSTSVTSGTLVLAESVDVTMTTGYYFEAYNGAATVFGVKRYGEIEITGNAAADMITVTAGNVQLDNGKIEIDTTQDITSYVKRNNATGTNAAFEVEQTHATGGLAVTIDQNATGDVDAVSIENAGTGFAVTTTGAAAGSRGYEFISATSGTASGFLADGTTGGASWIGANGVGLIQAQSDGALAHVAASLLYLAYSGNAGGANQTGSCLNIVETGTASGTSYAASINSTSNNALQVTVGGATKTNLLLTGVASQTASIAVVDGLAGDWLGAADVGMVHLKCDGALANAAASMLYSTYTGNTAAVVPVGACAYFYENGTVAAGGYAVGINAVSGNGLKVINGATGTTTATFACGAASMTASVVVIDGATNDWIGAATTGMLHLNCDGAVVADGSLLRIASSGQPAAANDGVCLEIVETGAAQATSYAVRITSTNNEAIHVDAGLSLFDEDIILADGAVIDLGGTAAARATTDPTNAINLANGTAPVGALANTATLYAAAGELRVMDAGGNSTLLSPHTAEGDFVIDSFAEIKQKSVRIHLEMLVNWLVKKFPEIASYVEYYTGDPQGALESHSPVEVGV